MTTDLFIWNAVILGLKILLALVVSGIFIAVWIAIEWWFEVFLERRNRR